MTTILKKIKEHPKLNDTIKFVFSILFIFGFGYIVLNYVPFVAKYNHYIIVTGSMEPIISINDVVIIDSSVSPEDLKIGDIIAFKTDLNNDGEDEVVVHYLSSIIDNNGVITYKTTPEISNQEDPWTLSDHDLLGLHVLTIPKVGSVLRFTASTIGRITLLIDVVVIYLLFEFIPKKKDQENTPSKTS